MKTKHGEKCVKTNERKTQQKNMWEKDKAEDVRGGTERGWRGLQGVYTRG